MTDLLRSRPRSIAIEITSKCNLRCSYCHKADPVLEAVPVANMDMDMGMIDQLYQHCKDEGIRHVTLSVGGETTFRPDWIACVSSFLDDPDIETFMVTNLARPLGEGELLALTRFNSLQISFDSSDLEMVRTLRSKADLRTITYNFVRLRQKARETGHLPHLVVNCTLCRANIGHVGKLAGFCRELGVHQFLVTEEMVIRKDYPDQPETVERLDDEEIVTLAGSIIEAQDALEGSATELLLQPLLEGRLAEIIKELRAGSTISTDKFRAKRVGTSACRMPWTDPMVRPDGSVIPCCGAGTELIGSLKFASMSEVVDGPQARAIRQSILDGKPLVNCSTCCLAQSMTFAEFRTDFEKWLGSTVGQQTVVAA